MRFRSGFGGPTRALARQKWRAWESGARPKGLLAAGCRRHSVGVRVIGAFIVGCSVACSSTTVILPKGSALRVVGVLPQDDRPVGTLYRDEVREAVQAGLGYFLRHVEVRAVTRENDLGERVFAGFEIVSLKHAQRWLKFDFAPGDVITRIDGVSVEHYDAVLPIFERLVDKDRFEIQLVRGGEEKTVIVNIRERHGRPSAAARGS